MQLTKRQFDLILEGLDAIEKAKAANVVNGMMLTAMLSRSKDELESKLEDNKAKFEAEVNSSNLVILN